MRTVAELSSQANNYGFSFQTSLRAWVHTSGTIYRQAKIHELDGDTESAYLLYLRYADLVLNRIPTHPQWPKMRTVYEPTLKDVRNAIASAERLKTVLNARRPPSPVPSRVPSQVPKTKPEYSRTSSQSRNFASDSGDFGPPTNAKAVNSGPLGHADSTLSTFEDPSVQEMLRSLRKRPSDSASTKPNATFNPASYPLVPSGMAHQLDTQLFGQTPPTFASPQQAQSQFQSQWSQLPPGAPKPSLAPDILHKSGNATESGAPLRTIFVPAKLREKFLEIAHPNTMRNLETAGILCGRLNRNAFFITHLVIPHQESTSDTCTTTNEEALFDYVESNDLFILGWIHTHPTQSCFMSSVDLHTQGSYQIMLPEAVAIVCAPQHMPDWGAFRLTDPPGIDIIKKCDKRGFHPHAEPNLYKLALPGHMKLVDYTFLSKDLRST